MKRDLIALFVSSLLMIGLGYFSSEYSVNENYSIQFRTKKAEGTFHDLSGTVLFNKEDLANSYMDVSVDVSTIKTGNEKKDSHAIGKKWFHVEKYPSITYVSNSIVQVGEAYKVEGALTIKDVTAIQEINFTLDIDNNINYLNGTMTVNRKDFNIKGNLFGFTVGKNVEIALHVPANFNQ